MGVGHTLFVAGYARFPQGMAAKSVFDTLTITAEIDQKYAVILRASCTLATEHGRDYIDQLLRGISLHEGPEEAVKMIKAHYQGKAANALVAAIKDLYIKFEEMKK